MPGINSISHAEDASTAPSTGGSNLKTLAAAALIGATALGAVGGAVGCKKKVSGEADSSLNSSERRVVNPGAAASNGADAGTHESVDGGSESAFSSRQPRGNTRLHYVYTDSQTGMADEVTVGRGGEIVINKANHTEIAQPNICITPKPDLSAIDSDSSRILTVNKAAGCVQVDVNKIQEDVRKCFSLPLNYVTADTEGDKNDTFPFCVKIVGKE